MAVWIYKGWTVLWWTRICILWSVSRDMKELHVQSLTHELIGLVDVLPNRVCPLKNVVGLLLHVLFCIAKLPRDCPHDGRFLGPSAQVPLDHIVLDLVS